MPSRDDIGRRAAAVCLYCITAVSREYQRCVAENEAGFQERQISTIYAGKVGGFQLTIISTTEFVFRTRLLPSVTSERAEHLQLIYKSTHDRLHKTAACYSDRGIPESLMFRQTNPDQGAYSPFLR